MDGGMRESLSRRYEQERLRLLACQALDKPQGEYASPVFGEGTINARLMLVGEAPGAEETKRSRPFVGKAGKQLDDLLALIAIPREALFITNVVKYRPLVRGEKRSKNRTPGSTEVAEALDLLRFELQTVRPLIVATLGNTPLSALLRLSGRESARVGDVHGEAMKLSVGGFCFDLFPLFHPASGIYNRSLIPIMEQDAVKLGEHLVKASLSLEKS